MSRQRDQKRHPKQGETLTLFEEIKLNFSYSKRPDQIFSKAAFRFTNSNEGAVMLCIFEQSGLTHFFHWEDVHEMVTENLKPEAPQTIGLASEPVEPPGLGPDTAGLEAEVELNGEEVVMDPEVQE